MEIKKTLICDYCQNHLKIQNDSERFKKIKFSVFDFFESHGKNLDNWTAIDSIFKKIEELIERKSLTFEKIEEFLSPELLKSFSEKEVQEFLKKMKVYLFKDKQKMIKRIEDLEKIGIIISSEIISENIIKNSTFTDYDFINEIIREAVFYNRRDILQTLADDYHHFYAEACDIFDIARDEIENILYSIQS